MSFDSFNGLPGNCKSERKLNDEFDQNKIFSCLLRKNSHHTNGMGQNSQNCSQDEFEVEAPIGKPQYFVSGKPLLGKSGSSDLLVDKCTRYDNQPFLEGSIGQGQLKKLSSESYLTRATFDDYEPRADYDSKPIQKSQLDKGDRCWGLDQRIASLSDYERKSLFQVT
jgi:hypothetical protein